MANFYSNSDRGYSLVLEVTQTGQNKSANQSTVRSRLILRNTTVTFAQYTVTGSMVINGTTHSYSGQPSMLSNNSSIVLLDKTQTVAHNSNGEKSINVSASIRGSGGYSPGSLSTGTKSFGLTTIPRVSGVSANNVAVGSSMAITINDYDSSFVHNLRYSFGSLSGYIARGIKDTYSWTVPATFAEQLPNATSGRGTLVCETYSGSTKIGESQTTFVLTIPEDYKPSLVGFDVSETFAPVANLKLGPNQFVQILSNPQVIFGGASGVYGSTITGYKAEIVGKNQSTNANGGTLGVMNYSDEVTIRASVTDSRGRISNTVDKTITVIPYFAPVLSFTATRSGAQNTTLTINRNAKIAPLTVGGVQKNKMTLTFKTAPLGSTSYTTNLSNASGTYDKVEKQDNSQANLSGTYATTSSFEVLGILEDSFTRTEFKVTVGTENYVYTYDKNGIGIGKARERGALDVKGDIYANDKPIQQHRLTDNTGSAFNDFNSDFDAHVISGYYHKSSSAPNNPSGRWGLLHVISADRQVVQYFAERDGTRTLFLRAKTNGNWTKWVEYAKADHPNLINSGWVTVGNSFSYKRVGDVIYLKYNFGTNGVQKFTVGNMPAELVPEEMKFGIAPWNALPTQALELQINSTGEILWINGNKNSYSYRGQVSWSL